jgi:hypothetical protein
MPLLRTVIERTDCHAGVIRKEGLYAVVMPCRSQERHARVRVLTVLGRRIVIRQVSFGYMQNLGECRDRGR